MLLVLKFIGGIIALCSLALVGFSILCILPEGDPLPKKKNDTLD